MVQLTNQKGYALLIVLFLIVFIMTITVVFINSSVSNAKQEKKVDENHLSVVAAEMGVEYYTSKFSNVFNEAVESTWIKHKQSFLEMIKRNPEKNNPSEICKIEEVMQDDIVEILNGVSLDPPIITANEGTIRQLSFKIKQDDNKNNQFEISNVRICDQPLVIVVEGVVGGVYGELEEIKKTESENLNGVGIEFSLEFLIPNLLDGANENLENNGGQKPSPPENSIIATEWPCPGKDCNSTVRNYMKVDDVTMKKGTLKFNDSLVAKSLRIDGGNGASITVAKDLYIENKLDVQTHACIAVQGDLTVGQKIESKNKMYIYVYGDAYFPSDISWTSNNNAIYVSGDVYIDGQKQVNSYKPVPQGTKDNASNCTLPGKGTNNNKPPVESTGPSFPGWSKPEIEVIYK